MLYSNVIKYGKGQNMKDETKLQLLDSVMSRQDYLVVQANDLARAFGNLRAFEHRLLDYCLSFVTKEDDITRRYEAHVNEILQYFGLNSSGQNYERVAKAFRTLHENTALYFAIERKGKKGVRMGQLFSWIDFMEDGAIAFKFSDFAAPYVFALKKQFYSFKLGELSEIKTKYGIILIKLWEANRYKQEKITTIEGTLEAWQEWFLGKDKNMLSAHFKRDVLLRGIKEIEEKLKADIVLKTIKKGRKVTGYKMEITDNRTANKGKQLKLAEPIDEQPEATKKEQFQDDIVNEIEMYLLERWPSISESTKKSIMRYISKYNAAERLEVLYFCYAIYCQNNGKQPGYVKTILKEWNDENITTLEKAREYYTTNHGPIEFEIKHSRTDNSPKWHEPNYQNDTTAEEKEKFEDVRQELLKKMEK